MEDSAHFTLAEAQRWVERTVITKTHVDTDGATLVAEQQGTVIGVHGEDIPHGEPVFRLAVQFWPEQEDAFPRVLFFDKQVFNAYLCLSHIVEDQPRL
jgi:hypothetical protein